MKKISAFRWAWPTVFLLAALSCLTLNAATLYVWQDSPSPGPPYDSWATAAHAIQDTVDAAVDGDMVLVTNGVYATGTRRLYGENRVVIDRAITLRSVNGPKVTVIEGAPGGSGGYGFGAVRCVYLAANSVLSGFTLTNGHTEYRDDIPDISEMGGGILCESSSAVGSNCVLIGNSAGRYGGGASYGTLNNCTLTGNSALYWAAYSSGGGAYSSTLYNCTLTGNSAYSGGGAAGGTLNNCTLTGNSAHDGGGTAGGTLNNCVLIGNSAGTYGDGGGAYYGTLNNCTLTGNSAHDGGGASHGTLNNCVLYFNSASYGANYSEWCTLNYCCTTPLPTSGAGNINLDPQLASASHLSADSSCRGAGNPAYASGMDIDGEPWANPPSIGCDEYHPGEVTGSLSVEMVIELTEVVAGYPMALRALIEGRTTASLWEFGDGLMASNQPYVNHVWMAPGQYEVTLRAYNESHLEGIIATVMVHVVTQPVHYVMAGSLNPVPPYTSWGTAAMTIQDAVDAVSLPGALVLVTNGVYATGGRAVHGTMTNRVVLDRAITLRSVNGPKVTVIEGAPAYSGGNGSRAVRCVYLAAGSVISGFTLTNGHTLTPSSYDPPYDPPPYLRTGGGVFSETSGVVTNCILIGNSANMGGGAYQGVLYDCTISSNTAVEYYYFPHEYPVVHEGLGGGTYGSTLYNCILDGNATIGAVLDSGGGAHSGTLNNCTLTGNSAGGGGGGAYGSQLINCIVYFNSAPNGINYSGGTLNYCCTTPLPPSGVGNITNEPAFLNAAGGNFRLASGSPCIDAGINLTGFVTKDLDGKPRPIDGDGDGIARYDMGAYENGVALEIAHGDAINRVTLSWVASPGEVYAVEETPSLIPPTWTNSPSGTNHPATVDVLEPQKYFRLREAP